MKLGAEPKKVAILGVLLVGAAVTLYINEFSGNSNEAPRPAAAVAPSAAPPPAVTATRTPASTIERDERRRSRGNAVIAEFAPIQGVEPGAEKPDPATIDPKLQLDLLAKLQKVEAPEGLRNIFQYGPAAPLTPSGKPIELPKNVPKIQIGQAAPKPGGPPPPPPAPTAPPMTFKYYGYKISRSNGRKEAFLLDGEDIIIAGENDGMKAGRYKVVRIGLSSITIEDMQFKSEQTLQLQPDAV